MDGPPSTRAASGTGNETTTKLLANAVYWAAHHPGQLAQPLTSGNETTTKLLANAVYWAAHHPGQLAQPLTSGNEIARRRSPASAGGRRGASRS